jgi:alcohol dehydrogenase class IV
VTDKGLAGSQIVTGVLTLPREAGLPSEIFADVKSNLTEANLSAGVAVFRAGRHDGVVAIGGGQIEGGLLWSKKFVWLQLHGDIRY